MATKSGFQVGTFPPILASPVWPTAPLSPAPKFVIMPGNVKFVPEYNWGQHGAYDGDDVYDDEALFRSELGAYGASEAQKRRARRKSAKLRARAKKKSGDKRKKLIAKAIAVEKKAGIYKKPKVAKTKPKEAVAAKEEAEAETLVDSGKVTEPDGVPANAEEGRANMKLIIGGTLALLLALGIGFAVTQSRKKDKALAGAPELPAPSPTPVPVPSPALTETPALTATPTVVPELELEEPTEVAGTEIVPSVANPFRPSLRMLSVRRP